MKTFKFIQFSLFIAICLGACKNKPKDREQQIAEFRSELTAEDTTTMLKICDDAMELLKQKKIDNVMSMLYEYTDSTKEVKPLQERTIAKYKRMFQMFPVLEYKRKYYSFMLEGCNDVKYEIVFATAEQSGTDTPAKTQFMFNPVKIDGDWKLCVKTADEEIDNSLR